MAFDLMEILQSSWFWVLFGLIGIYTLDFIGNKRSMTISQKKDVMTTYFGIGFFVLGFTVHASLIELFVSSVVGGNGGSVNTIFTVIFALIFFISIRAFLRTKWFREIGIVIMAFILGMMARGLYEVVA